MKKLLVAIIATIVAVGALSASITLGFDDNFTVTSVNPLKSTAQVMGHVVLTVHDENGAVTAYRQTDNVITNIGDSCIATVMLSGTGQTCTNSGAGMYDTIAIGTGDSSSATETTTKLATYLSAASGSPTGFVTSVISHGGGNTDGASTLITTVFSNVGATITEAAIQAGSATLGLESVLAIQSFTGLPLGPTDNLTIQWTVVIDG